MEHGESKAEPVVTAASRNDWAEVRRLVESGANPNACDHSGVDALYYAITGLRYDEMRFLLEHGADTNLYYFAIFASGDVKFCFTAVEFAASRFPNLDQVLALFLDGQPCPPEMLELRALRKLYEGDRQSASECFFGPNSGDRNFDELIERSIQVVEKRRHGDISHKKLGNIVVRMLRNNEDALDANTVASIITNLIRQQKPFVAAWCCFHIDIFQTYEVLDLLVSKYNEMDDGESWMLIYVMVTVVNRTIHMFKRGEVSQESVSKLAALVLNFPDKTEVLFRAVESPWPDTIKFLVEECRCDPHALKTETSKSTLDILFSNCNFLVLRGIRKEQVRDSAKFLMDLGVHSCPRLTSPRGRKIMEDFPELFRTVRKLNCLAASKIVEEGIDTDGFPDVIKKFIKQH